jgi:hypothetical protein
MFKIKLIVLVVLFSNIMFAQAGLEVHVYDMFTYKPMANVTVLLLKNNAEIKRINSDTIGNVKFQPIDSGRYDIKAICQNYCNNSVPCISVYKEDITHVDVCMISKSDSILSGRPITVICDYFSTDVPQQNCWSSGVFNRGDINNLPTNNINYILDFFPRH